jgi:hypothetical protein
LRLAYRVTSSKGCARQAILKITDYVSFGRSEAASQRIPWHEERATATSG